VQKAVVIISICLQSSNAQCNLLQGWLGFFMKSACVPEKVVEVFAHAGLSISLTSIHNAVSSISKEIGSKIKARFERYKQHLHMTTLISNSKLPTLENRTSFVSATSATVIPLYGIDHNNANALRCSTHLWDRDPRNPSPSLLLKLGIVS